MTANNPYAFTGRYPIFRNRIVSDVWLCSSDAGNTNATRIRALWDTGCSNSIISSRVAEFLALETVGTKTFRSPFGGCNTCDMKRVKVCIVLGSARLTLEVGVHDSPDSDPDCDITLGLDFITQGDFAITHDGEQLTLSFCYPPIGVPNDYTVIAPRLSPIPVATEVIDIDEANTIESRRKGLILIDYYDECNNRKQP